jgi:exosortase
VKQPEDILFWVGTLIVLLAALCWGYWSTIHGLFKDWGRDQNYSVGQLVPLVALYLVWHDRDRLRKCRISPSVWGMVLIILAQGMRVFGLLYIFESAERYALVVTIAGLVLLVAGKEVFRQTRWILLFLFLMVPLPGRVHNLISGPLQNHATAGAVFFLELLGVTVSRLGNVIVLNDSVELGVAEACSGLRMLTAFVVVAATLAYVVNRPRWQKATLILSSVPVAIICNLARLVVTAELFLLADSQTARTFFHDYAGLTMMPLAVFILAGELALMNHLVVSTPQENTPNASRRRPLSDKKPGSS